MWPRVARARQERRRKVRRIVAIALVFGAIWFGATIHRGLRAPAPSQLLLDRRGRYLGEVPCADGSLGVWPTPYVLPEKIVRATIETEDRKFFDHRGVYVPSILRAAWQDVTNFEVVSGASTIAMQVSRMQSPLRHGPLRKLQEAAEALFLVHDVGHEQVLRQYLTLAPYGNRVHGIVRAARLYFDKPVEDLSWAQAAFLAGLPQAPGRMNPYETQGLARATKRSHRILRNLHAHGVITADELAQALDAPLGLVPRPHRHPEALHAVLALSELAKARKEVILTATLDLDVQLAAAKSLKNQLARLEDADAGNGAVLVIDPENGAVLAHVGSSDYFDEDDHGALDYARVKRSPGSALKPFIYGLALEKGPWTAASELADTPVEFASDDAGGAYLPENLNHVYLGPMLLRQALANSRNIPALRVLSDVGVEQALRFFEKSGVSDVSYDPAKYGLSLAIGGLEVTLEELVTMYTALPNHGETRPLRWFESDPPPAPVRLLAPSTADLLTNILSDPTARRPSFPAGGPLDFDYAVAAKTGTSQGHRDAWTVAYSDRLLIGAWVGNHDRRRMRKLTGASAAAEIVHVVMDEVMPTRAPWRPVATTFGTPQGFETREICPLSGHLAGPDCPEKRAEIFAPGTAPTDTCTWHAPVHLDRRNGLRAGPTCPAHFTETRALLDLPTTYDTWARAQHLELAPHAESPLCPLRNEPVEAAVRIKEPRTRSRYLFDPDTPPEASAIRLSADVTPADEDVVWIVDGSPVARVGFPHELRWSLAPGAHTIVAMLARGQAQSRPVLVTVDN